MEIELWEESELPWVVEKEEISKIRDPWGKL